MTPNFKYKNLTQTNAGGETTNFKVTLPLVSGSEQLTNLLKVRSKSSNISEGSIEGFLYIFFLIQFANTIKCLLLRESLEFE